MSTRRIGGLPTYNGLVSSEFQALHYFVDAVRPDQVGGVKKGDLRLNQVSCLCYYSALLLILLLKNPDLMSYQFDRMNGLPTSAVFDLGLAGDARGGHNRFGIGRPHGGEEGYLTHVHGKVIMLGFVAEGTGHAAAACIDHLDRVA